MYLSPPAPHFFTQRQERCLGLLSSLYPQAEGLFVFGKLNIYHLTGSLTNGVLWLPKYGEATLFVRRNIFRVQQESCVKNIQAFSSYTDIFKSISLSSSKQEKYIACDKQSLPWSFAELLQERMPGVSFIAADKALQKLRAVKDSYEQELLRLSGSCMEAMLCRIFPQVIRVGMSEYDLSIKLWESMLSLGYIGPMRMSNFGEEGFLGHVCVGENGLYPSHFNGPLGVLGVSPAVPFMGSPHSIWQSKMLLAVDTYFSYQGYLTDKTQLYFSGTKADLDTKILDAHKVCQEIENYAAEQLRPGAIPAEIYKQALSMAEKAGFSEGFMGLTENKVPFLGHSIGLTIDEWPVLAKPFQEPIEENMFFAIEPKISIPHFGMVGTENTYKVTSKGAVSITGSVCEIIYV